MSDLLGDLDESDDDQQVENQGDINNDMAVDGHHDTDNHTENTMMDTNGSNTGSNGIDTFPSTETQQTSTTPVDPMETTESSTTSMSGPPTKRFKFGGSTGTGTGKSDKTEMSEDEDVDITANTTTDTINTTTETTNPPTNPTNPPVEDQPDSGNTNKGMFTLNPDESTTNKEKAEEPSNTDDYPRGKPGFIDFFWFDAYEDPLRKPGEIYLFGKRLNDKNQWKSVCVWIRNIERTMYVLPRLLNKTDDVEVGERAEVMDVYTEINEKRKRLGITKIAACPIEKRYCFRERRQGIPAMAQYLKMCYSFKSDAFSGPQFDSGKTYSKIFGVNSTALELFILDKQIMGPCWLRVPAQRASTNVSWCPTALQVDDPDELTVLSANFPSPNFKVLSLSFQTVLNDSKQHEVAAISGIISNSVCIDYANRSKQVAPSNSNIEYFTYIRKIDGNPIPYDLEKELKLKNYNVNSSTFQSFGSERELLSFFVNQIQRLDPDVIVGHKLYDFVLDVILNRMKMTGIKNNIWSKIGRLKRGKWPFMKNGMLMRKNLGSGRLLADTFLSSQEFLIGEKTYTLSHLAAKMLDGVDQHENLPMDKIKGWWLEGKTLAEIVTHVANDANLVLQLMHKLEVLPLTKVFFK